MRGISLILLLFGVVWTEPFFHAGKEYEFDYEGSLMSGIPELGSQFSGLSLAGKIILQAIDSQTFKLALKGIKVTSFNEKLTNYGKSSWKTFETPAPVALPEDYRNIIEMPVQFTMINGEISDIHLSENEFQWSLNFKKSLISLVKVQSPVRMLNPLDNSSRQSAGDVLANHWRTMEQGVDGICENTYHLQEIQKHEQASIERGLVNTDLCNGKKVFELVKHRNVDNCVARAVYRTHQPGYYTCSEGNCDNMWESSSTVRYLGCGVSADRIHLQSITNEAELRQSILAYKTEDVVTGTKQKLILQAVRSSLTALPEIEQQKTVEDLLYEYPKSISLRGSSLFPQESESKSYVQQQNQLLTGIKDVRKQRFEESYPENESVILAKLSPNTLVQAILKKVKEIVTDLDNVENLHGNQIASRVMSITKSFSLLSTEHMATLYTAVKGLDIQEDHKETARQLVLEISAVSGTNPAIMFLKEQIESEEISSVRAGLTIAMIPHYIKTPTVEILDQIFELIQSEAIENHPLLKQNARLAFATLLKKACIDEQKFNRFPVFVFGQFCSEKTDEIIKKYIPYFVKELEKSTTSTERQSVLMSIGSLGHESVIPLLLPYIEGLVERSTPDDQRTAILSLTEVCKKYRDILLPIYSSLVHNKNEDRFVRISALSMMLKMQPDLIHFQKLASSTWYEQDTVFQKFMYSTLKSLSEIEIEHIPTSSHIIKQVVLARSVLPMAKSVPLTLSSSLNKFTSEWLRELQVGYNYQRQSTLLPSVQSFDIKLDYFLEQLRFTPIELAFESRGVRHFLEKLTDLVEEGKVIRRKSSSSWERMVSSLNLEYLVNEPTYMGVRGKLFDDVQFKAGLEHSDVDSILDNVRNIFKDPKLVKDAICGQTPINLVKFSNWNPNEILIPSDMGFPILTEVHMPTVVALKGELNMDCSAIVPAFTVDLATKVSVNQQGYVGTISPITEDIIAAGIDEQYSVNLPNKIGLKLEQGILKVDILSSNSVPASAENIDIVRYSIKPFTVIKPLEILDYTPLSAHANTKIIHSASVQKQLSEPFGQSLGLDMHSLIETEADVTDLKSIADHLKLYNNDLSNLMLFSWTKTAITKNGKPSARFHSVKIVHNPSASKTAALGLELSSSLAEKRQNQAPETVQLVPSIEHILKKNYMPLDAANEEHSKLLESLSQIDVEDGRAVKSNLKVSLHGQELKLVEYVFTASQGTVGRSAQKWTMKFERVNSEDDFKVCMDGKLGGQLLPKWNIHKLQAQAISFDLVNNIGFGASCQQYSIKLSGSGERTAAQTQFSKRSREAKKCTQLTNQLEHLSVKMNNMQDLNVDQSESQSYEHIQAKKLSKQLFFCQKQREQASTLDKIEINIEHSQLPESWNKLAERIQFASDNWLSPYLTIVAHNQSSNQMLMSLQFSPEKSHFDMDLAVGGQVKRFKNVRMSQTLSRFFPLVTIESIEDQVIKAISQESVYPKCRLVGDTISTFDNNTMSYSMDSCFHVVTADCTASLSHAILAKTIEGRKHIRIHHEQTEISVSPAESFTPGRREFTIVFNGRAIELNKNTKQELYSQDQATMFTLKRSSDDVIEVVTPHKKIYYDATTLLIENRELFSQGRHCGLCGSSNGNRKGDLKSAQLCIPRSKQAAALSFRIQNSCPALSSQQRQVMDNEQARCVQETVEKSPITQIYDSTRSRCSQMKHAAIKQGNQLCISKVPVAECGTGCSQRALVEKPVAFACISSSELTHVAGEYEERVRQGQHIPELKGMPTQFTVKAHLPTSCVVPGL